MLLPPAREFNVAHPWAGRVRFVANKSLRLRPPRAPILPALLALTSPTSASLARVLSAMISRVSYNNTFVKTLVCYNCETCLGELEPV